jgi:N-acetylglutamate synthase-like GNAT family acetyltransferase
MLSAGAPPRFVVESQRASLDEVRHARACFALAARYGAGAVGPASLGVRDCLDLGSLAEIAALAAQEGCVGETIGVALIAEALAGARDPEVIAAEA